MTLRTYGACSIGGVVAGLVTAIFAVPLLATSLSIVEEVPDYRFEAIMALEHSRRDLVLLADEAQGAASKSKRGRRIAADMRSALSEQRGTVVSLTQAEAKHDGLIAEKAAGWRTDAAIALLLGAFGLTLSAVATSAVAPRSRESIERASIIVGSFGFVLALFSFEYLYGAAATWTSALVVLVLFGAWLLGMAKAGPGRGTRQGVASVSVLLLALVAISVGVFRGWPPHVLNLVGATTLSSALLATLYRMPRRKRTQEDLPWSGSASGRDAN